MVTRQPNRNRSVATIREVQGHYYRYLGQLDYECGDGWPGLPVDLFRGVGVRLYQDVDGAGQYLCIESSETGDETWYRIDGARLTAAGSEDQKVVNDK